MGNPKRMNEIECQDIIQPIPHQNVYNKVFMSAINVYHPNPQISNVKYWIAIQKPSMTLGHRQSDEWLYHHQISTRIKCIDQLECVWLRWVVSFCMVMPLSPDGLVTMEPKTPNIDV
jgi:hypothetical protein